MSSVFLCICLASLFLVTPDYLLANSKPQVSGSKFTTDLLLAKAKKKKKKRKKKARKQVAKNKALVDPKTGEKLIRRRVLILDFVNQKKDKNTDYLQVTIPEAYIGPLKETNSFEVINRDKGKAIVKKRKLKTSDTFDETNAINIGKDAKADVVVVGSFVSIGGTVQIHAKAVDVLEGRISVSKTKIGKTDASIFETINSLAKEMAKEMKEKLKPLPPRVIIKEREKVVYREREKKPEKEKEPKKNEPKHEKSELGLALWLNGGYAMPMSTASDLLAGGYFLELGAAYRIFQIASIELAPALNTIGLIHSNNSSQTADISFKALSILGGLRFSYQTPFKPLYVHILGEGGYTLSTATLSTVTDKFESGNIAFAGSMIIEYRFTKILSALLGAKYWNNLYKNNTLSEIQIGGGIGVRL